MLKKVHISKISQNQLFVMLKIHCTGHLRASWICPPCIIFIVW